MIPQISRRTALTLAMTAVVLVGASGVAMAAAPSVDTEATDTATQSALNDGDTVTTFNASASVNISTLQASYDSTNPGIKIVDPETGDVIATYTNSSNPDYFTETGSASGNTYYNTTFSEADFAAVPMSASENKSVTLRLINDTTVDDPDVTNVTIFLENTDERAVVTASESFAGADVEETDPSLLSSVLGAESENTSDVEADGVGVNGSQTTVYVVYHDDTVAEPYETAADNKSAWGGLSSTDYESGDMIGDHIVRVEETPYAIYSDSAPERVLDASGATYAVYDTVDGEPAHRIELGDAADGESSLDIETAGNQELGFLESPETFGDSGWFGLSMTADAGASTEPLTAA